MALITCPDCKKDVSDAAAACIHCGCTLKSKSYATKDIGAGGCIYVGLIGAGLLALKVGQTEVGYILLLLGVLLLGARLLIWSGSDRK